jgi:repressor LexA
MRELTEKQRKVYEAMARYQKEHGYPPTLRELANIFKVSPECIRIYMYSLVGKGYVRREDGLKHRAYVAIAQTE